MIPFYEIATGPPPIEIPEGRCGDFRIRHKVADGPMPIVGSGWALSTGWPECEFVPPEGHTFTCLDEGDLAWTSTIPSELWTQWMLIHDFSSDVLLGGLGLGLAAVMLARKPEVRRVVVVERAREVIELVAPHLHEPKVEVVNADAFDFMRDTDQVFDFAYQDFWPLAGHHVADIIRRARRASLRVVRDHDNLRVRCWAEDIALYARMACAMRERAIRRLAKEEGAVRYCMTRKRLAEVFAEWARRARENPEAVSGEWSHAGLEEADVFLAIDHELRHPDRIALAAEPRESVASAA